MAEYDLISKTALLRHLDMAIDCEDCPRNTDRKTYYERCACSEVADICNTITDFATFADVQPFDRWTSIEESKPKDMQQVLAVVDGDTREAFYNAGCFIGSNFYRSINEVKWWQPLPEPPKDGDAE